MPFGLKELFDALGQPTLWILLPILFVQFVGDWFRSRRKRNPAEEAAPNVRDSH